MLRYAEKTSSKDSSHYVNKIRRTLLECKTWRFLLLMSSVSK